MAAILLDLRLLTRTPTGVGRYLDALASGLPALLPAGTELVGLRSPGQPSIGSVQTRTLRGPARLVAPLSLGQQITLARQVNGGDHGLFHYPYFDLPIGLRGPIVTTCYDLEPLRRPELFPARIVAYYRLFARRLKRSTRVIVISGSTARDVVDLAGVVPDRVQVSYLGVSAEYRPIQDSRVVEEYRRKARLPERFVLYVGNTMPHKNLQGLALAMKAVSSYLPDVQLILAGARDRYRSQLERLIEREQLGKTVRFIAAVPEPELPILISAAEVFAYPSFYEGFGLPVLEAMACGTPVVASSVSSLPEVIGEAGVLVDPTRVDAIADGILRVLSNRELAQTLARLGVARAREFSWQRCVAQHASIYLEILGSWANRA